MKRIIGAATSAALATGLLWPAPQIGAQLPTKTLSKPLAELSEPFTSVRGVRELADGRVIVADPRDKVVQLVDFKTGRATRIGREGSGPNEYQMPMNAFALPGDSTMIFDALNSRFLMLGPGGSPAGTWALASDAPRPVASSAPRPAAGGGGGASFVMGGIGGGLSLMGARVVDAQGRLYLPGARFVAGPDGRPQPADSVPVVRMRRPAGSADTVAWTRVPKNSTSITTTGGGRNSDVNIRIGGQPFSAEDGWSVFPDGRVAVVRTTDYHVDIYPANGRGAPVKGASVRYTPIRVTDAEREAWRAARRASPPMVIARREGGGAQSTRSVAVPPVQEPDSWPAVMPAFQTNQVHALPNGQLWVGRYTPASDKSPRFDVFDATGKHTGQVVLPPRTSIVGFGMGVVYTVRADEDDLQYLQRFAIP